MNPSIADSITTFHAPEYIQHARLLDWVKEIVALTKPKQLYWCDGSQAEYDQLCEQMVTQGTLKRLNPKKRPRSFLAWSHPNDVARVEERTFICSATQEEAGPTNNWMAPAEMRQTLIPLFDGCMRGRTLYVVPFSRAPQVRLWLI